MRFNEQEIARYSKHLNLLEIGQVGQEKLKAARVLVVGAGGLGCPSSQLLASSGVGHLTIVDGDVVEASNLQRQFLYSEADLGKKKAEVLAGRLQNINPHIQITAHPYFLSEENIDALIEHHDIVLDCTDAIAIKRLLGRVTASKECPLVYASLYLYEGQLTVFNHNDGGNYFDLFPERDIDDRFFSCAELGVYAVLPGIIGSMQANEAIKVILQWDGVLNDRIMYYHAIRQEMSIIKYNKEETA